MPGPGGHLSLFLSSRTLDRKRKRVTTIMCTPPAEVEEEAYETSWDLIPTDMSWVQEIEGYDNGSMPALVATYHSF